MKVMAIDPDVAWAAGLFEGEGYFSIAKKKQDVCMGLAMVDQDVVARFATIVEVGYFRQRKKMT